MNMFFFMNMFSFLSDDSSNKGNSNSGSSPEGAVGGNVKGS